jgi:hypothetical protein
MLNCRVIVLETDTLTVRKVALSWYSPTQSEEYDTLHVPTRIFYDEPKSHVYVGFQNGKVLIYRITKSELGLE